MKTICSCGDSFMSLDTRSTNVRHFLDLFAESINYKHVSLGKSGASNFCIRLQIEHAIHNQADLVIIGASGSKRIDFNNSADVLPQPIQLNNIDYTDYKSLSYENVQPGGQVISDSLNNYTTSNFEWVPHDNFRRGVSQSKIDAMKQYEEHLHDSSIGRTRDYFIIESGLRKLQQHNIPFIFFPGPLKHFDFTFAGSSVVDGVQPWDMPNGIDSRDIAHNTQSAHNNFVSVLLEITKHYNI